MAMVAVAVFMRLYYAMHRQIDTQPDEQDGAYMAEPFLEVLQLVSQVADAHGAITYQPSNQHDRQSRAQPEDHRH